MAMIDLSSPWVRFYRAVNAMFERDAEVHVVLNTEDDIFLKLYVDDPAKAEAISKLLPPYEAFGNVEMKILVVPSNKPTYRQLRRPTRYISNDDICALFETAFIGNPTLKYTREIVGVMPNPIRYIVFDKTVVQYFTDDLGDINGLCSTLYQDIARDIFVKFDGVYYCTDKMPSIYHIEPSAEF